MNESAAPATPRASSVSHSDGATANTANAAPHDDTVRSITAPWRGMCRSGPENTAVTMPPTPIAAVNKPRIRGSPWKRRALIAGNSDRGSAKNVAFRSMRNVPARTRLRQM